MDRTGIGALDAGEDFHQGALAGTVLADQCQDLSPFYMQIDLVQSAHAGKALVDRARLQERH